MKLKKFTRYYGLTLLPASHSQIMLGDLVWKTFMGKYKLEHKGMPNHIFNAFYDAELLDIETHERGLKRIQEFKKYPAHLSHRSIKTTLNQAIDYSSYEFMRLNQSFELKKINQYQFENIHVRLITNEMRISIDYYIEQLQKEKWKGYDGNIKRVYMITELYYGNLEVKIDKKLKSEFFQALKKTNLEIKNKFDYDKNVSYIFKGNNIPFAMRLERVQKFNG